ncbi:polyketide cyclase [Sphingobacteriaceae bacterium]|nr:polyketide cyclase [Sphingobacteriaceae bacterium]
MSKEIRTEIQIYASKEKIWSILMDFKNYSSWNPFLTAISGQALAHEKLQVRFLPPGKKGMTMRPTVLEVSPLKVFRWKGRLFLPGIFDGEHIFELKDLADGSTLFIQREKFNGILVPLLTKMLDVNTVNGFKLMNEKLKNRAETL